MWRRWIVVAAIGALAPSACKRNETAREPDVERGMRTTGTETRSARDERGDDSILGILAALNQGEIDQANAAMPKLASTEARNFAQHMVAEHTQAATQAQQLGAALGKSPRESTESTQLKTKSQAQVQSLTQVTAGPGFDRMYMQAMVDGHTSALSLIDSELMPNAKDNRMRTLLEDVRRTVDAHLKMAQSTLQALPTSS